MNYYDKVLKLTRLITCLITSDLISDAYAVSLAMSAFWASEAATEVFCKKSVLRNVPETLFNKVAGLRSATLLKKSLWYMCFSVPQNAFFKENCFWSVAHCFHYFLCNCNQGLLMTALTMYSLHKTGVLLGNFSELFWK